MELPIENTPTNPTPKAVTWNDVVVASAEANANRIERTQTFDRIMVDLTVEERASLGEDLVAADAELSDLTEEKKEAMASFKARIAKVESKKREIADAITKKKAWREAPTEGWTCEEIFATNERRYLDTTGRIVCTEAMTAEDRQLALPVIGEDAEAKAREVDPAPPASDDVTDPEALLAAAQRGEDADPEDETLPNEPSSYDLSDEDDDSEGES